MDVDLDLIFRWMIVIEGLVAAVIVLVAARAGQRVVTSKSQRAEIMGTTGGAAVCLSAAAASFGVMFNLDTVFRLPFVVTSLTYLIVGRVYQLWLIRKAKLAWLSKNLPKRD